jgi:ethanolamine utilization protein EutL
MRTLIPQRPTLLAVRQVEQLEPQLARALGLNPARHVSAAFLTCDQDDSLFAALDHATKFAPVDVVYAKSFYAGSAHASGPFSGESIGVLAAADPTDIGEGLWALRDALASAIHFSRFDGTTGPAFFAHVIPEVGRFLAPLAQVPVGASLAYLIAPPLEALVGLDAALKASNVRLQKFFGPPTETNFGGAYLTGAHSDVEAAAEAFVEAIGSVVHAPLAGLVRPERERR